MTKEVDNRLRGSGRQAGRGQLPGRTAPLETAVSRGLSQLPALSHSVQYARQMLPLNQPLSGNLSHSPFRLRFRSWVGRENSSGGEYSLLVRLVRRSSVTEEETGAEYRSGMGRREIDNSPPTKEVT